MTIQELLKEERECLAVLKAQNRAYTPCRNISAETWRKRLACYEIELDIRLGDVCT